MATKESKPVVKEPEEPSEYLWVVAGSRPLMAGDRGDDVKSVQSKLNQYYGAKLEVNGEMNEDTVGVVKSWLKYQKDIAEAIEDETRTPLQHLVIAESKNPDLFGRAFFGTLDIQTK